MLGISYQCKKFSIYLSPLALLGFATKLQKRTMDLDLLSWNCRGICGDDTRRALKDLIVQNRPQIVFLCETKISRKEEFQCLQRSLGFPHAEMVLSDGRSGGLGMFWTAEVGEEIS